MNNKKIITYYELQLKESKLELIEKSYPIIAEKDTSLVIELKDDYKVLLSSPCVWSSHELLNEPHVIRSTYSQYTLSAWIYTDKVNKRDEIKDLLIKEMLIFCETYEKTKEAKLINKYKGGLKWVVYTN